MDHEAFLKELNETLISDSVDDAKFAFLLSEIARRKLEFLPIVMALQDVLTNQNVNFRQRGLEFLSKIITQTPGHVFNTAEISVIANFYGNYLKEHHSFLPATLNALVALAKMKYISRESTYNLLVNLFQNVNCNSQPWKDRLNIYTFLDTIIENHFEITKEMGSDFIFGLISFIEGETDPKCLLLIFKFLPSVIKKLDLGHFSEELFELLSCYFPVDFNASVKDDTLITREDLAEGLNNCLTANECFCELALPLIFEKLKSNLKVAKIDSYKLLQTCCKYIKVPYFVNYSREFWKEAQKDILPENDKEICEAGLSALTHIIRLLSNEKIHNQVFLEFSEDILISLKPWISKVNENMFQCATKVLVAISEASEKATCSVLNFFDLFYTSFNMKSAPELKIILPSFLPILIHCSKYKLGCVNEADLQMKFKNFINLYLNSALCDDYEVRKSAFCGIFHIIPDLTEDLQDFLLDAIINNIKSKDDIKHSEEFSSVLRKLGKCYANKLYNKLIQDIQLSVHQVVPFTSRYLFALSFLADLPFFTDIILPIFLKFIFDGPNFCIGLENFLRACRLAKREDSFEFYQSIEEKHNVSHRLLIWCRDIHLQMEYLQLFSELLALIVRNQNLCRQQDLVQDVTRSLLNLSFNSVENDNCYSAIVMEAVLGSVRPEVKILYTSEVVDYLISLALFSAEYPIRLSSSRLLASIINKSEENMASEIFTHSLNLILNRMEHTSEASLKNNCGFLFTWIMKGIVLRGKPSFEENVEKWFELLGREGIGEAIAENFHIVLEDDNLYLNYDSHCNVRVLYRQKLFQFFPKLLKMYETSHQSVQSNYLLALVRLLSALPVHLIQTNISSAIIVLIKCLSSNKQEILLTVLEILKELLKKQEKILMDYINNLVPKFLDLASYDSCMKVRINSLECLFFYCFYPTFLLLPLKSKVTKTLELCLDDKKRLVRKVAVRTRCRWFLVGAPGEDLLKSTWTE